ncbi:uncharacterized protein EV420DRAFT_1474935 [Desarmillaria tabescens]|uniref:Uncharacterized protein n=1 Tax=Armillaria tabescens TaxID=1929756 RepID=A0AA39NIA8_ARMTA|nr:uncharacterized protein EV420DRAFT_1474935 [Desarmillaria tabescens]KAK0466142.1 hypothetical protein EV420DRAFT_1474935 [Desarmillaria tabescens]
MAREESFDRVGFYEAAVAVKLSGLDTEIATAQDRDDTDPRFICLRCSIDRRSVIGWRAAMVMHCHAIPDNWVLLSEESDIQLALELEKQAKICMFQDHWSYDIKCTYCSLIKKKSEFLPHLSSFRRSIPRGLDVAASFRTPIL